jgi:hypothetical protein
VPNIDPSQAGATTPYFNPNEFSKAWHSYYMGGHAWTRRKAARNINYRVNGMKVQIEFSLSDGEIVGVLNLNDNSNVLSVLGFLTASGVQDAGLGAIGIYEEDPRNKYFGSFFDRLYLWTEAGPSGLLLVHASRKIIMKTTFLLINLSIYGLSLFETAAGENEKIKWDKRRGGIRV